MILALGLDVLYVTIVTNTTVQCRIKQHPLSRNHLNCVLEQSQPEFVNLEKPYDAKPILVRIQPSTLSSALAGLA